MHAPSCAARAAACTLAMLTLVAPGPAAALCAPAPAAGAAPLQLSVRVGGFLGDSHIVVLTPEGLACDTLRAGQLAEHHLSVPTPAQWATLRQRMDTIGVWAWQARHFNMQVMDGTQWLIDIRYADRAVQSQGSNSYPLADGSPSNSPHWSEPFKALLQAVSELVPGCGL